MGKERPVHTFCEAHKEEIEIMLAYCKQVHDLYVSLKEDMMKSPNTAKQIFN